MTKEYLKSWALILGLALMLVSGAAYAQTPADAVANAVATSEVFPAGTSVVNVLVDGNSLTVELSVEAAPFGLGDGQADAMGKAIRDALEAWPELTATEITVAGLPLWQYLPPSSAPDWSSGGVSPQGVGVSSVGGGTIGIMSADGTVPPLTSELAGKLVALHPSHGSYWHQSFNRWFRAMRTLCGPNPTPPPPGWTRSVYQPSNYYYYTKGFQWGSFYEDDRTPQEIRFLRSYLLSSNAAVVVSRNLDKNAGEFPAVLYGYPNPLPSLPRWQVAAKYHLQELGYPSSVWNEPTLTGQVDKDIRARPYMANYHMAQLGYAWQNCVSFSLHTNAAGAGTARGTEIYWYVGSKTYLQSAAIAFTTAVENRVINAIKNGYDGFWAEPMYSAAGGNPPEWPSGTYRGYQHAGASTPSTTSGWQDRGVKTTNFGEIREALMPAGLMELVFHDDWKFYPDHVFALDPIFQATVAWGMYEGICNYFSATPKPRLAATVQSASGFPSGYVAPNSAINGTVTMRNEGQAWCWGNKWVSMVYSPYTVWNLKATANDQFIPGTKIAIDPSAVVMPSETATFNIALTAPATTGTYTTEWQMLKDDARGGSFGSTASAQIQVDADAPVIDITAPAADSCNGANVTVGFSVSDPLSGIDTQSANIDGTPVNSGDSVALATGSHTLTVSATDKVGNSASKSLNFTVDATAPVITIGSPSAQQYALGCIVVGFSASDEGCSGLASTTANIDGTPVTNGQTVCWLGIGSHTLTVAASDNAGNAASQQVAFTVVNSVGKVSVGGWIELADKKGTCGFICNYVEGAGAPTGNLTYQDHDTGMTVKAESYTGLGISGNHAWLYGPCTIDGAAGHWFRVDVIDNGEPGNNDLFNITLDTGYTKGGNLGGGNVTIH